MAPNCVPMCKPHPYTVDAGGLFNGCGSGRVKYIGIGQPEHRKEPVFVLPKRRAYICGNSTLVRPVGRVPSVNGV